MTDEIVIDANVVIKRVVPEMLSNHARELLTMCRQKGTVLHAPAFSWQSWIASSDKKWWYGKN